MEMILNVNTLPESLFRLIHTEQVRAREMNGEIRLTPVLESKGACPLRGLAADSELSVDTFIAGKQTEKELQAIDEAMERGEYRKATAKESMQMRLAALSAIVKNMQTEVDGIVEKDKELAHA